MTKLTKGRDPLEDAAFEFLKAKFASVHYEPNGGTTFPDFLANEKLLYEVTRLETTVTQNGSDIHFSRAFFPLIQSVERSIEKISGSVAGGRNVFINLDVTFPCDIANLRKNFRKFLQRIAERPEAFSGQEHALSEGIISSVEIGSKTDCPKAGLGCITSPNLTGWVHDEVVDQIGDALKRKGKRLLSYEGRFDEAWLVVGCGPALGFRREYIEFLGAGISNDYGWTGIVILSSLSPVKTIEWRFEN